ncbi:gastrula zinc finger protein XlCGF26.1-like isoform X2 [Bacillus rossius redtenbacheri]
MIFPEQKPGTGVDPDLFGLTPRGNGAGRDAEEDLGLDLDQESSMSLEFKEDNGNSGLPTYVECVLSDTLRRSTSPCSSKRKCRAPVRCAPSGDDAQAQMQACDVGMPCGEGTDASASRKRREGWDKYPWMCTDCAKELPSMHALRIHHQMVHNQPPRFLCPQCNKVYTKYYGFVSHVRRHKNHMKFCCEECGKCFSNKKVMESHRATHSDARPFVCAECGKAFRQQSALYVHNRSHQPEALKNKFPCDQCDKRFSTKPNLVTHKRIHTGVRNYTCDQCGKSFIQKGNLDAHLLTHSLDKPHACLICGKCFKTPLQLRKHETVHTGAKPHQCDVCGRQFRERGTLREHHRIHTGAMPFSCEFCGKRFRFKGILTTHRRQHTGERPYSCLECQHHFTNWPNYNKHMKRRHSINTSLQPDPNKVAVASQGGGAPHPPLVQPPPLHQPLEEHPSLEGGVLGQPDLYSPAMSYVGGPVASSMFGFYTQLQGLDTLDMLQHR